MLRLSCQNQKSTWLDLLYTNNVINKSENPVLSHGDNYNRIVDTFFYSKYAAAPPQLSHFRRQFKWLIHKYDLWLSFNGNSAYIDGNQ